MPKNKTITFVGDASLIHKNLILSTLGENALFCDNNNQSSFNVGKAAFYKYKKGICGDSSSLLPLYLKKSQAERMLEEGKI